jgi:hypothetical protein
MDTDDWTQEEDEIIIEVIQAGATHCWKTI